MDMRKIKSAEIGLPHTGRQLTEQRLIEEPVMAYELVGALSNILERLGNRRTDNNEIAEGMQVTELMHGRNQRA